MGLIRLLLALAVVFGHTNQIGPFSMIGAGDAVSAFFVISGFYMALILNEKYADLKTFYLNRALRLYPAYYVTLCACIIWFLFAWRYTGQRPPPFWVPNAFSEMAVWKRAALIFADWSMVGLDIPASLHYKQGSGFLFLHGDAETLPDGSNWGGRLPWIEQGWSLGTELWFYAVAPFLVRGRWWVQFTIGLSSFAFHTYTASFPLSKFLFPSNLWLFVLGSLAYAFYRSSLFRPLKMCDIIIVAVVAIICFASKFGSFGNYLAIAMIACSMPFIFERLRGSKLDMWVGELSYPIYLTHLLVAGVLKATLRIDSGLLVAIVSISVSIIIIVSVERPVDRFRQYLAAKQKVLPGRVNLDVA